MSSALQHPEATSTPIIYDTDLGTDVDDAIALAFLATDPRCELLAVTTVNGDVRRRAALAQALLDLAGRGDVPVGLGASDPMSAQRSKWMPIGLVAREPVVELPMEMPTAEEVIVEALRNATTPVHVCGVGAFTNVATVLGAHPELYESIAAVHLMGGCLRPYANVPGGRRHPVMPDYNLNGDPVAAAVCLGLPLPLRLVPQDVTNDLLFTADDRAAIAAAGALGQALEVQMAGWVRVLGRSDDPEAPHVRLHDPLAVVGVVQPEVEERLELRLSVRGDAGHALIVESPHGRPVTVARAADAEQLRRTLVAAITCAGGQVGDAGDVEKSVQA